MLFWSGEKSIRIVKGILGFRVSYFHGKKKGEKGKKKRKTPELFPGKARLNVIQSPRCEATARR